MEYQMIFFAFPLHLRRRRVAAYKTAHMTSARRDKKNGSKKERAQGRGNEDRWGSFKQPGFTGGGELHRSAEWRGWGGDEQLQCFPVPIIFIPHRIRTRHVPPNAHPSFSSPLQASEIQGKECRPLLRLRKGKSECGWVVKLHTSTYL
ncbi:unnamed protein product [Pleuronectes platessa]|uniref:Uncharacterized protein n=1 Tax=Pleuronectes platessa TaxID=8262 RepID=A0A9N7VE02_PLEPL|nr:unnamed protein product [Pleuronectes platessa]